ncbi:MAG: trypsin-like serine protease [Planctomycetia bacterium]|nr:trypsin-like serine protease [Planctomycetia bacterium]
MRKNWLSAVQALCSGRPGRGQFRRNRADHFAPAETCESRVLLSAVSDSPGVATDMSDHTALTRMARIVNGTPTSDYPAVGLIGDTSDDFCSGTLIAPQYVLTAGHCAEGVANTAGTFTIGGRTYHTERVYLHPGYNSNAIGDDTANDIAIYKLSEPVVGIAPIDIYRATPQVGQLLTLVGFGGGGTGTTGSNGDFGIKRVGTTPIDQLTRTLIHWDFDNNSEANTAPGDSGGPAFVTVGGVKYVAGVTSGGDSANASIGDHSFDTRVDAYADWITSIVGVTGGGGGVDLPTLSIVASDANAAETLAGQAVNLGTYTISRTGSTADALTVSLSYTGSATNGSDYSNLPSQVTIPAGQSSVTVTLTPIDDSLTEPSESVIATLQSSTTYNLDGTRAASTVTIADNDQVLPTISLRATDATAAETRIGQVVNRGQYQISRTGLTTTSLTVFYTVSGSATNGSDYSQFSGSITIPAGKSSVTLSLNPVDDSQSEGTETVILTLAARSNYAVDTTRDAATVTIEDNDAATVRTNDNFVDRRTITGSNVTVTGDNRSATSESGEPNPARVSSGKSVWWTWTAPSSGRVTISTAGSSFDTTLGVYTGTSLTALRLVAENDDGDYTSGTLTSQVTFNVVAGTKYQILVDSYDTAGGDITLKIAPAATAFAVNRSSVAATHTAINSRISTPRSFNDLPTSTTVAADTTPATIQSPAPSRCDLNSIDSLFRNIANLASHF